MIVWSNYDEWDLKEDHEAFNFTTGRCWYNGEIKRRSFFGFKIGDSHFGLSPTIQTLEVIRDRYLRKLGLVFETKRHDWQHPDERPITTLTFDIDRIIEEPYMTNICQYLDESYQPPMKVDDRVIANVLGERAEQIYPNIYRNHSLVQLKMEFVNHPNYKRTKYFASASRAVESTDI